MNIFGQENKTSLQVNNLDALQQAANTLAENLSLGDTLGLSGDLGAGKTTLVQYLLKAFGYNDLVTSPTFSLIESYHLHCARLGDFSIHHFDLYRLDSLQELENIGFREYFNGHDLVFIEWPDRAENTLPKNTIQLFLSETPNNGRMLSLNSNCS